MRTGFLIRVAAASRAVTVATMPAGCGIVLLADVLNRQRRHCPPELLVRGKDAVVAVPVLPRRRHEVRSMPVRA